MGWLGKLSGVLRRATRSHNGPMPKIGTAGKNTLGIYKTLFEQAQPLQIGARIQKKDGEQEAIVKVAIADLAEQPLLLRLGNKNSSCIIGLYVVKKSGQDRVVVADIDRALRKGMPGTDYYIVPAGKNISIGREVDPAYGIKASWISSSVSRLHLTIACEDNQVYLMDVSTYGTTTEALIGSAAEKDFPHAAPKQVKPRHI